MAILVSGLQNAPPNAIESSKPLFLLTSSLSRPRRVRLPVDCWNCCSRLEPRDSPLGSSPLNRRPASALADGDRSSLAQLLPPSSQEVTAATVSRLYFLAASLGSSRSGGEKEAVAQHPLSPLSSSSVSLERPPPAPPPPPPRQEEGSPEPTRS